MLYNIVTSRGKVLHSDLSEYDAERMLCREINNGVDAYIEEVE